jgi:hypothetical protein
LVALRLRRRGHEVLTPDLPADDDTAGLREYADTVVEAIGDRADVIVVAQSIAAFTTPMLCDRVDVRLLVLVAPMIPGARRVARRVVVEYWPDSGAPTPRREGGSRSRRRFQREDDLHARRPARASGRSVRPRRAVNPFAEHGRPDRTYSQFVSLLRRTGSTAMIGAYRRA